MALNRTEWLDLSRKLDWDFSYAQEEALFPPVASGQPWLPKQEWASWDEPYKITYSEYVRGQHAKDESVKAVREAVGRSEDFEKLDPAWINGLKLHAATLPLAEFAAVIGNLRAARFGRDSAWRSTALLGALDECRHTQIPLSLMNELVKWEPQFDWAQRFYHTNNWVAIAARHAFDELLLGADPIEFAIATNFVFETGFTNLQFIGLASLARGAGDKMFEKMLQSIQTDEARHAQIGPAVLRKVVEKDPERAQYLLDKWFWRSWQLFAVLTGFSMDYFTPAGSRTRSFKEFMEEWVIDQYLSSIESFGLKKPWYWDTFIGALDHFHHRIYASAYTYRASVWFDFVLPGPEERAWLAKKYPKSWPAYDQVWGRVTERWREGDPGNDWAVHATAIPAFCNLCQLVLCGGTSEKNSALVVDRDGRRYVFCSEPCRWIFEKEPERYSSHKNVVDRVLAGEAPGNLLEALRYFGLDRGNWGKDAMGGVYPWLTREAKKRKI